jgi:hypothetical protein
MLFDTFVMLVMAGVLTLLGLIAGYFMVLEVVALLREFISQLSPSPSSPELATAGAIPTEQRVKPYRDRTTVKRLIDHLEEED